MKKLCALLAFIFVLSLAGGVLGQNNNRRDDRRGQNETRRNSNRGENNGQRRHRRHRRHRHTGNRDNPNKRP